MSLDIVVVTYRSADAIEPCLRSIPRRPDLRLFVIENASGDAAAERAAALGAISILNRANLGFGAAANQGARLGTGDAILFLNPDARLTPGAIDALLAELDRPGVAVVGATLRNTDGSPQRSWWPFPAAGTMWREAFGVHRLARQDGPGFVVGACFLVRRQAFDQLGGFDERYWLYGEEADLCYRATMSGLGVVLCSEALVDHEGGASGRESSDLVAEHFARGSELFVMTHHGGAALFSYRLAGLVASLLRWLPLELTDRSSGRLAARRRQIKRTVKVLLRSPFSVAPAERPPRAGADLVVLSLEPWDEVWRRNQLFVRELLQMQPQLKVLWIEPPQDVLHEIVRFRRLPGLRARTLRPLVGDQRVLLFQPRKWLPRSVWPWVDRSLNRQVLWAIAEAGLDQPTLWVNDSTYDGIVAKHSWRAVYDITDDWLDSSLPARQLARVQRRETNLMRMADEVVVCSPELARRRSEFRLTHLISNAVDVEHFRAPQPRPDDLPPGPTSVYVGSLHEDRIDVELIARLSSEVPGISIVLVGPNSLSGATNARLGTLPNVSLLGPKAYEAVPAYLQHADVVIVPHVVSRFTESLDPIKAYECLAVGRPTLATPVAGFRELGAPVVIADREGFADALRGLLSDRRATVVVDTPSWAARAEQFLAVLTGDSSLAPAPERMRVAYLGHTAVASGGELALARLLPGLTNVEPIVLLGEDGPIVSKLVEAGAKVEIIPMSATARTVKRNRIRPGRLPIGAVLSTARYSLRISRELRRLDVDLVHTNTLKAAIYGGVAGRLAGVPVVWHVRDRIADDYLPRPAVSAIRFLARFLPSAIITNSNATRSTLAGRNGLVAVAASPVVYDPVTQRRAARPEPGHLCVGMIGRIAPWKGQDIFLRAFAQAFPDGAERAVVVGGALFGESDFGDELAALTRQLGISERVEFTGHVDDISPYLDRLEVVVHASIIPEPFGQVVVEAMAAGLPVVASAAGGPLEIIRNDVDGLLVTPSDIDALADALRRLADDPALRNRLGERGRLRAAQFRPERIGPQVERIYRRLLSER